MPVWEFAGYWETGRYRHKLEPGFGHALMAGVVSEVFRVLRVSAAVENRGHWWSLHTIPNIGQFELEHGTEAKRHSYNQRQIQAVRRQRKPLRGEHAGFSDYFVPILAKGEVAGVLVSGPFALTPLTTATVLDRWYALSKRRAHANDPAFAAYLSHSLQTLVLDQGRAKTFEKILTCLARLLSGEGLADELANRADALRVELSGARNAELTWESVDSMIHDRSTRIWSSLQSSYRLHQLGLSRPPDHVLAALASPPETNVDPVEETIKRDAFQRDAVRLARTFGNAVAGRIGDRGTVFLCATTGSNSRKRQRLLELSERASSVARREFGLSLHFGLSVAKASAPLGDSYRVALLAAESAAIQNKRLVWGDAEGERRAPSLYELRRELGKTLPEKAELLRSRVDGYLDAVALQSGYRTESARGYLDAAFERVAEPLVLNGELDQKSFGALLDGLARAATEAATLADLFAAYRSAFDDLTASVQKPLSAHHDRSLRRALDYVREHYTDSLGVARVARVAGFTPNYFSQLFKQHEGKSFTEHVSHLRVERAKTLLATSKLDVGRVASLSGFHSAQYFARVFRRLTGLSPLQYRQRQPKAPLPRAKRSKKSTRSI